MPYFTIDSIRENPWNAIEQDIPPEANGFLLYASCAAAKYCVESECDFMQAARQGDYTPPDWAPGYGDVHEGIEERFLRAGDRHSELHARLVADQNLAETD